MRGAVEKIRRRKRKWKKRAAKNERYFWPPALLRALFTFSFSIYPIPRLATERGCHRSHSHLWLERGIERAPAAASLKRSRSEPNGVRLEPEASFEATLAVRNQFKLLASANKSKRKTVQPHVRIRKSEKYRIKEKTVRNNTIISAND